MRRFTAASMILVFGLCSGCASKYGEQQTQVNYYPACYQPIQDLRGGEHNVAKNTGAGALLGAFTGAMIGLIATGKWQGALIGGATGGVAGSMAGNAYGRYQQEKDDNVRMAGYLQNLDGDISNLDVTRAAAKSSLQCYDRAFASLLSEIKAKQISRQAAESRFGEIMNGREEAINILGNAAQYGQNLNQEYENAFNAEEQQAAKMQTQAPAARQQKVQAINRARQHKQNLVRKTTQISQERQQAVNETSRQTREINEAYAALQDIRS